MSKLSPSVNQKILPHLQHLTSFFDEIGILDHTPVCSKRGKEPSDVRISLTEETN